MNALSIIMVVVFVTICLLAAALMFVPQRKSPSPGISINVNKKAVVKVSEENGSVHLDIDYDSYEDRPSDTFLFPELNDELETEMDVAFWRKVAGFDDLNEDEQRQVKDVLCRHGFRFDDAGNGDDNGAAAETHDDNRPFEVPDSKDTFAPVSPDPSHEEAYERYRDEHSSHGTLDDDFDDDDNLD